MKGITLNILPKAWILYPIIQRLEVLYMLAIFFVYVKWLYYPYSNAAIAEVYKIDGDQASEKKDFIEAVRLYKDALNVQCKDDSLNTELKKGEQKTSRL